MQKNFVSQQLIKKIFFYVQTRSHNKLWYQEEAFNQSWLLTIKYEISNGRIHLENIQAQEYQAY